MTLAIGCLSCLNQVMIKLVSTWVQNSIQDQENLFQEH